ncbi:hypothetical protein SDC9_149935 [bioreactor metagenome]|uniref:Uncharacterized protein n=1 Tax=bioreactor metagenome TaxID=1076179 RepID=A0A645ENL3_9ZZZZ
MVAVHTGNAHLAHHLEDAVVIAMIDMLHGFFERYAFNMPFVIERFHRFIDPAQMDSLCAVTDEAGDVMHFSWFIAVHDQRAAAAQAFTDQVVMYACGRQQ